MTIPSVFFEQAQKRPEQAAFQVKRSGHYEPISWKELAVQVDAVAVGLMELGLAHGDRTAILSENRPEWAIADLAILQLGGVTVPVYATLTTEEIGVLLRDSGAKFIFVSSTELMAKVVPLQKEFDLKVILFDSPYAAAGPRIWWIGELLGTGKTASPETKALLEQRRNAVRDDDLASLIYTSGTTGTPKGVMLTHSNFVSNCRMIREAIPINENDTLLSFLPLSHVFERTAGYYFVISVGGCIAYAENAEAVPKNLVEVRPTVVTGVPRFYEKFHERVLAVLKQAPPLKKAIFHWALRTGEEYGHFLQRREQPPVGLRFKQRIADRLVFRQIKERMGGRIRFFVSGGAPLSPSVAEFFFACGVLIIEGYGLTETSPVIAANRLDRFKFGSVGIPLPGAEVKIAEDGEILTRGPHIMKGYYQNPAATAEAIDADRWFHTGDIGVLDANGFLTITDRKKDLIKTSGGKMVAPQYLEAKLKNSAAIDDAVVIGDKRKYLSALLVPNPEQLAKLARELGLPPDSPETWVVHPKINDFFQKQLQTVNQSLAQFEQIKRFALLPQPFSAGAGELTPTLKIKRRVVAERYAREIDSLYPS